MGIFDRFKKKPEGFNLERLLVENDKDKIIMTLDQRLQQVSNHGQKIDQLTSSEKTFLFVENLEREVNNGGLNQFFWNSSGNYAHETVEALKTINANKTAELLSRANATFPNESVPKNRMERQETQLLYEKKIDPELEKLDQQLYRYPDNLSHLLISFVKNHRKDFE